MKGLALGILVILSALSVGCSASHSLTMPAPLPNAQTTNVRSTSSLVLKDLIDNDRLTNVQRQMLLELYKNAPRHRLIHPYAETSIVAIAILDGHGHIVSQFANRRDVRVVRLSERRPILGPATYTGTGPYHQLIQSPPTDSFSYANLTLPCSSTDVMMPNGSKDTPYAYLGGYTTAGISASEVESGEQGNVTYSLGGGSIVNNWATLHSRSRWENRIISWQWGAVRG